MRKNAKINIIIWCSAAILVIVAVIVTQFYKNQQPDKAQGQNSGNIVTSTELTDFTLKDLDGKTVSLSDFKGKNIYLNFWATWCPPCRGEMPGIEKIYQQYKNQNLVVLAVDLGENFTTVNNFIQQNNYHFRILLDSDQSVASKYNITSIPDSYFIDKNGNIIAKRVGALSEQELQSYIQQLLKS